MNFASTEKVAILAAVFVILFLAPRAVKFITAWKMQRRDFISVSDFLQQHNLIYEDVVKMLDGMPKPKVRIKNNEMYISGETARVILSRSEGIKHAETSDDTRKSIINAAAAAMLGYLAAQSAARNTENKKDSVDASKSDRPAARVLPFPRNALVDADGFRLVKICVAHRDLPYRHNRSNFTMMMFDAMKRIEQHGDDYISKIQMLELADASFEVWRKAGGYLKIDNIRALEGFAAGEDLLKNLKAEGRIQFDGLIADSDPPDVQRRIAKLPELTTLSPYRYDGQMYLLCLAWLSKQPGSHADFASARPSFYSTLSRSNIQIKT